MKEPNSIYKWTAEACRKIAFLPDRKAMARELTDHFEDHCDALREGGMSAADAEELALRAMGDAEEVGEQLAQVYNTVWTWLWLISRWFSRIAVAVLIWFVFCYVIPGIGSLYFYEDGDLTPANWAQETGAVLVSSDVERRYLGYNWTVTEWARDADTLVLELVLRDQKLTVYDPIVGLNRVDVFDQNGTNHHFMIHRSAKYLTRYEYTLVVEHLTQDTKWLELHVQNSDFAMRVDLTKGGQE